MVCKNVQKRKTDVTQLRRKFRTFVIKSGCRQSRERKHVSLPRILTIRERLQKSFIFRRSTRIRRHGRLRHHPHHSALCTAAPAGCNVPLRASPLLFYQLFLFCCFQLYCRVALRCYSTPTTRQSMTSVGHLRDYVAFPAFPSVCVCVLHTDNNNASCSN